MKQIRVLFFGPLKDALGKEEALVRTPANNPKALFQELGLGAHVDAKRVRIAVNGDFASWETPLQPGDELVFIPPVAGG